MNVPRFGQSGHASVISDSTMRFRRRLWSEYSRRGWFVTVIGARIFRANTYPGTISDVGDQVVAIAPFGVLNDPARGEIFISSYLANDVMIRSDSGDRNAGTVPRGDGTHDITYDNWSSEVYVGTTTRHDQRDLRRDRPSPGNELDGHPAQWPDA